MVYSVVIYLFCFCVTLDLSGSSKEEITEKCVDKFLKTMGYICKVEEDITSTQMRTVEFVIGKKGRRTDYQMEDI